MYSTSKSKTCTEFSQPTVCHLDALQHTPSGSPTPPWQLVNSGGLGKHNFAKAGGKLRLREGNSLLNSCSWKGAGRGVRVGWRRVSSGLRGVLVGCRGGSSGLNASLFVHLVNFNLIIIWIVKVLARTHIFCKGLVRFHIIIIIIFFTSHGPRTRRHISLPWDY